MKLFRRFIAALLVICFAGQMITAVSADEEEAPSMPINYGQYENAITAMFRFKIIEEEGFLPEEKVTRGEFVSKALRITGLCEVAPPADTRFHDVKADNALSGDIEAAAAMGIICGFEDGNFHPEDTLTAAQSAKILMSLLGYDTYAKASGGYPAGYLTIASTIGLLNKVSIANDEACTWNVAAQLIYNAMESDVLQKESYGNEKYFSREGENPLTLWMNVFLCEGTVAANEYTAVSGNPSGKGTVRLCNIEKSDTLSAEEQFSVNNSEISSLLGYPVKIYYSFDDKGTKNIMIAEIKRNVKKTEVNAKEILPKSTVSCCYWCTDDNKTKSMSISDDAVFIYNGKTVDASVAANIHLGASGNVTLADFNSNGVADLVDIHDIQIYVVKDIYASGVIVDKYSHETLRIPVFDSSLKLDVKIDGRDGSFGQIKKTNVLEVSKSLDSEIVTINVSTVRTKGVVGEIGDDYIFIDDEKYDIIEDNKNEFSSLSPGDKSTFYFTADVCVAGFAEVISDVSDYGYITVGAYKKSGVRDASASVRIFNLDSNVEIYDIADAPALNGSKNDASGEKYTPESLIKALEVYPNYLPNVGETVRVFCNRLVKYKLDETGKISAIETPFDNTVQNGGSGENINRFSLDYSYHNELRTSYTSFKTFGFLAGMYMVKNSKALRIPDKTLWEKFYMGIDDISVETLEKRMYFFDVEKTWPNDARIYDVDVYDVAENRSCQILVEQSAAIQSTVIPELDFFLVERMVEAVDEDGIADKYIYGIYDNEYKRFEIDTSKLTREQYDLKPGDVIRVARNSLEEITDIYKIFTLDKKYADAYLLNGSEYNAYDADGEEYSMYNHDAENCSNWNRLHTVIHAKSAGVDGDTVFLGLGYRQGSENEPLTNRILIKDYNTKIYVFDEATGKVRVGSLADLDSGNASQSIVVRNRYYEDYETVIINRKEIPDEIFWVGSFDK